jgi:hypothetical protein
MNFMVCFPYCQISCVSSLAGTFTELYFVCTEYTDALQQIVRNIHGCDVSTRPAMISQKDD